MWRKLHFFIILEESLQCTFVMHVYPLLVDEVNEIWKVWVWKYEFEKCVLRESQIWMPRRPKVPIVEERHMYCFIPHLTSSLSSFLLSSQDLNRDWGSEWRQRRTKKETWLAHREESDQRAQDRKVPQLTSPSSQPWGRLWLMFTRFNPLPRLLSLSWSWSISRWSCGGSQCGRCRLSSWSPW